MGKIIGLTFEPEDEAKEPGEVFSCPHCGKGYKTEKGLAEHIEKTHGQQ